MASYFQIMRRGTTKTERAEVTQSLVDYPRWVTGHPDGRRIMFRNEERWPDRASADAAYAALSEDERAGLYVAACTDL